jgi:hypothetical protein
VGPQLIEAAELEEEISSARDELFQALQPLLDEEAAAQQFIDGVEGEAKDLRTTAAEARAEANGLRDTLTKLTADHLQLVKIAGDAAGNDWVPSQAPKDLTAEKATKQVADAIAAIEAAVRREKTGNQSLVKLKGEWNLLVEMAGEEPSDDESAAIADTADLIKQEEEQIKSAIALAKTTANGAIPAALWLIAATEKDLLAAQTEADAADAAARAIYSDVRQIQRALALSNDLYAELKAAEGEWNKSMQKRRQIERHARHSAELPETLPCKHCPNGITHPLQEMTHLQIPDFVRVMKKGGLSPISNLIAFFASDEARELLRCPAHKPPPKSARVWEVLETILASPETLKAIEAHHAEKARGFVDQDGQKKARARAADAVNDSFRNHKPENPLSEDAPVGKKILSLQGDLKRLGLGIFPTGVVREGRRSSTDKARRLDPLRLRAQQLEQEALAKAAKAGEAWADIRIKVRENLAEQAECRQQLALVRARSKRAERNERLAARSLQQQASIRMRLAELSEEEARLGVQDQKWSQEVAEAEKRWHLAEAELARAEKVVNQATAREASQTAQLIGAELREDEEEKKEEKKEEKEGDKKISRRDLDKRNNLEYELRKQAGDLEKARLDLEARVAELAIATANKGKAEAEAETTRARAEVAKAEFDLATLKATEAKTEAEFDAAANAQKDAEKDQDNAKADAGVAEKAVKESTEAERNATSKLNDAKAKLDAAVKKLADKSKELAEMPVPSASQRSESALLKAERELAHAKAELAKAKADAQAEARAEAKRQAEEAERQAKKEAKASAPKKGK